MTTTLRISTVKMIRSALFRLHGRSPLREKSNYSDWNKDLFLFLILLILIGTIGASSWGSPNNLASYAAFFVICLLSIYRLISRIRTQSNDEVALQAYDFIPSVFLIIWLYGFILGLVKGEAKLSNVVANFAGMVLYVMYYLFIYWRVSKFSLLRIVVLAAAINAFYMYSSFFFDKIFSRWFVWKIYVKELAVRSYYSDTLIILAVPIALTLMGVFWRQTLSRNGQFSSWVTRRWVKLIIYSFSFLIISLSKSMLLSFCVICCVALYLRRSIIIDLFVKSPQFMGFLTAVIVLLCAYPATHILRDYFPEIQIDWTSPSLPLVTTNDVIPLNETDRLRNSITIRNFLLQVAKIVPNTDRILIRPENASLFEFQHNQKALVYRGSPYSSDLAETDWHEIETGAPAVVGETLERLGIRYVLVQSWQPPLHVPVVCSTAGVAQSDPVKLGSSSSYLLMLLAANSCGSKVVSPILVRQVVGFESDLLKTPREIRSEQTDALLGDLELLGKGLGASISTGYKRDSRGYGFEQNYLNLVHKFGIFSFFIFFAYAVQLTWYVRIWNSFKQQLFAVAGFASLITGLIMGWGNPVLMSPIFVTIQCVSWYCLRPRRSIVVFR